MGDPKFQKKQFETPRKRWDKQRIEDERRLIQTYGLKNKKEIYRARTILRNKRQNARALLALPLEQRMVKEKELIDSLVAMGLLRSKAVLDDVLSLEINSILERRLQTLVWRKNLANTVKQARQFIVHGKIAISGRKVDVPGFLVPVALENQIGYYGKPMQLNVKKTVTKSKKDQKKDLRKEFEEALPDKVVVESKGKEESEAKVTKDSEAVAEVKANE